LFWALYYKHEGPQRKKYSWEVEEEIINSLDGIEVVYQEIIPKEQTQESVTITYDYVLKK
jgi:hypothetical protein